MSLRTLVVVCAGLALVALLGIGVRCRYDAALPFLPNGAGAAWIVYPVPPQTWSRGDVPISCTFRRAFELSDVPAAGMLEFRSFRSASVVLNGMTLPAARTARFDVTSKLRPGRNELVVTVTNDKGPPALWLRLESGGLKLASRTDWEASISGSNWERASDAAVSGEIATGDRQGSLVQSLRQEWVLLLLFAVVAAALLAGARRVPLAALGVVAVGWTALFVNDFRLLPMTSGFDVGAHLDYIKYVRDRKALPLATEGWEMYQPPLYYVVAAAALGVSGADPGELSGKGVLRAVSLAAGLAQLAFIFASLRLLFPSRPRAWLAGGLIAAFVPVHLYLYQYATNEALAATLASAAVYLGLRVLREDRPSPRLLALLGLALGAALLTKLTALLVAPALFVALGAELVARRRFDARSWLTTIGIPLAVAVAVCGWHYARVWSHFGSPFIGNWDERVGVSWWQDPGYRTASYYLRFGRSITDPFFSGLHGFLDGLYSTFWGDGLWGGAPNAMARPPWNYELMRLGYVMAIVPSLLIITGFVAGAAALWRRTQAQGLMLAGLATTTGLALIYMTLKVPSYAQVKAFYALPAIVPLCAAAGYGFELVARRTKIGSGILAVALGVWALDAYASFWIVPGATETLTSLGVEKVMGGKSAEAVPILERAVAKGPASANSRFWLGYALYDAGRRAESDEQNRRALELDPSHTKAALALAMGLDEQGHSDEALAVMRRAVAASPDDPETLAELGRLQAKTGAAREAIETFRRALGRKPDDKGVVDALAAAYARAGQPRH